MICMLYNETTSYEWIIFRPLHALGFAAVAGSTGLLTLYFGTNGLTALLGASNLILYTMVYTPLKRISILNTWVGSVGKNHIGLFF